MWSFDLMPVVSRGYDPKQDFPRVMAFLRDSSFCTFRVDLQSRVAELEPMGTLPKYRRMGLAKAIIAEGFRRISEYSPTLLYIGGAANTLEANRLYEVTGFTEKYYYYFWRREKKLAFSITS